MFLPKKKKKKSDYVTTKREREAGVRGQRLTFLFSVPHLADLSTVEI